MVAAVDSLREAGFNGDIIDANSSEFTTASRRFSAIFNSPARLIAFPGTAEDVSIAVLFASRTSLPLAVKCGGHHAGGASAVDNGLVIDLSHLKSVRINKERSEVTVAGGCLWGEVYTALRDEGLACVGGGVHNVGICGHLLGGGYGPLTQRYGMACDNIVSATVVLANGKIVQASDKQNPDLFWGIKGASSNFGIAVEVVLKTFPDPGQWVFRSLAFSPDDMQTLAPRFVQHVNAYQLSGDVIIVFLNFVRGPGNKPLVLLNFTLQGTGDQFSDVFKFFLGGLKPLDDSLTTFPSLVELSHCLDDLLLDGPPRIATGALPVMNITPTLVYKLWERWLEYTDRYTDASSTKIVFEMHKAKRVHPEASCIRATEQGHSMILISEEHNDPSHDATALEWVCEGNQLVRQQQIQDWGKDLGVWANASMPNETAEDCWGQNYPRLQKLKAKYDPGCLFDKYWHIEPSYAHI
ncbi:FAD-binding PCMH-type domain-containing protein [Fusarium sp. Ph1]|nr:FAD-binding PCMH-type domain-containing protein [Fusarium sp. Ph1]